MNQLLLLTISFGYGLLSGFLYCLINKVTHYRWQLYTLFNLSFFITITILYVLCFYYLNQGDIHLYLKLTLIIGFILAIKSVNLLSKRAQFSK